MTGIRIPSHNPEDWFLGVIKFFDSKKNFGYIASNNHGMTLNTYEQDFWVNSECFTDPSAKVEGALVVFQWEHQSGGKRRAKNVHRFSKSKEEDCKLAMKYCGAYEVVQLKERKVNMLGLCCLPRQYLLPQLKETIVSQGTRSPESTLEIFKQFVGKYKTILPPNNWRYIFSKDFDSELKSNWIEIFEVLTTDEWIAVLNQFSPAVIYADDSTIDSWLHQLQPRFYESSAREDFKYTKPLLADEQQKVYADIWRISAENDFLEKLTSYKENGEIPQLRFAESNELQQAKATLAHFSDNKFEEEIQDCIDYINTLKYHSNLEAFSKSQNSYVRDRLEQSFRKLSSPLDYIGEFIEIVSTLIKQSVEANKLEQTFDLLNFASRFSADYAESYLWELRTNVEESLRLELTKILSDDNCYEFKRSFEPHFSQFTALYDEDFRLSLKELLSQQIETSKSIDLLLYAADSPYEWISQEEAMALSNGLIALWSFDDIDRELKESYNIENIDERIAPQIFIHAISVISNYKLEKPFRGISEDPIESYSSHSVERNLNFLKRLLNLNHTAETKECWSKYVSLQPTESLLLLYDKELIADLPNNIVEQVINNISLEDTFQTPDVWYSKPSFQNKSLEKILSNSTAEIFAPISKRLVSENIGKENIGLFCWLTELLIFNRPQNMDYYEQREWDKAFSEKLCALRNSIPEDSPLIAIIWAVYMQTRASQVILANVFPLLPPYLQIRIVKKLFSFVAQGKMKHTAKSMYDFLSSKENLLSLPVEIAFSYLILRENDPTQNFNNGHMLQLIDGREDHSEWIGIRQFVEQCPGRWLTEYDEHNKSWKSKFYNGKLTGVKNSTDLCLFIPNRMIDSAGGIQNYNNKHARKLSEIIKLNFNPSDYQISQCSDGVKYYFKASCEVEVNYLVRGFNILSNSDDSLSYTLNEDDDDPFCECRLSLQLSNREGLPFYWCGNKPCFRPWARFHTDEEWERYTLLDFMRILNIPVDYTNLAGKTTKNGYFIIFSSYLKSFAKFYEHLKCRKCHSLLHPVNITNFATHAVTEFSCTHEGCEMNGVSIYLNHCFNKQKCKSIIDSRDSKQCPNGQYICPECGACCSTSNFRNRISNLCQTGGFVSPWLKNFVDQDLGHWEHQEYFCYSCGAKMEIDDSVGILKCPNCGTTYDKH